MISVWRGFYRHVGLVTEAGNVLSLNPGLHGRQVLEESVASFCKGGQPRIEQLVGLLPKSVVMQRARSGKHPPYDWTRFNCEHFVRFAHGLPLESPQFRAAALLAGVAGVLCVMRSA